MRSATVRIRYIAPVSLLCMIAGTAPAATVVKGTDPATLVTSPDRLWSGVTLPWVDQNPSTKHRLVFYQQTDPMPVKIYMRAHKKRAIEISEAQ